MPAVARARHCPVVRAPAPLLLTLPPADLHAGHTTTYTWPQRLRIGAVSTRLKTANSKFMVDLSLQLAQKPCPWSSHSCLCNNLPGSIGPSLQKCGSATVQLNRFDRVEMATLCSRSTYNLNKPLVSTSPACRQVATSNEENQY